MNTERRMYKDEQKRVVIHNVSIICDDEANKIELKSSGSIQFKSDCRLVTDEVEMKTEISSDTEATKLQMHRLELHSNASFDY